MSLLDITENIEQPDIRTAFVKRIENLITDHFYKSLWHPRFAADNPIIHISIPKQIPQYFIIGARVNDNDDAYRYYKYYRIFDIEKMVCTPNGIIQLDDDEQLELKYKYKTVTIGRYTIKTEFPPVAGTIRLRIWKSDDVFNKTTDFGYIDIDMYALQYTPDRYRGLNFINLLKEY